LLRVDSEVQSIASSCNPVISLDDILLDAQQETCSYLLKIGARYFGRWDNVYNGPDYGGQAFFTESSNRPRYSLSQIVVTDAEYPGLWTDLQRYMVYVALYNFYRDASRRAGAGNNRDRYAEKRDVYEEEIKGKYQPRMIGAGIPLVGRPMPRPGAQFEPNSGTWSTSNLSLISGGSGVSTASYQIAIAWQDTSYPQNSESAPSDTLTISVPAGQKVQIDISSLNAPNGNYRPAALARMPIQPLNANYWNVYAGIGNALTLQARLPYSQKTYALDIPAASATPIGVGQYAEMFPTLQPNQLFRG
jgi:hypothetical protein